MSLDEKLNVYVGIKKAYCPDEEKINRTIEKSKEAFWIAESQRSISWIEFLYQQAGYIRKGWWFAQGAVLVVLWLVLFLSNSNIYERRSMGILAPIFVILLLPEFWKNRNSASIEVEGAAYFSLQKIYAARMILFGMADVCLLSIFFAVSAFTVQIVVMDLMIQFILPLNITCGICFQTLSSRKHGSIYVSLLFCLVWVCVWMLIVLKDSIYETISAPLWTGAILFSILYLCYTIYRVWKCCDKYWEVNSLWN